MRTFLDGGYPAMLALKEQGAIDAIGIGVNEVEVCATQVGEPIVPPPPPPPPHPPLPNTGVQAYLNQLALMGGLALVLGLALLGWARRKDEA